MATPGKSVRPLPHASPRSSALEYKLVVLGGGGVGKSALTIRLVTDNYLETYDPTIEDTYRKECLIDDHVALLEILDTAGQDEFSSMRDQWIRDGRGFLLVYDITNRPKFEEAKALFQRIIRTHDSATPPPIVLAGNKCDLKDERVISYQEGADLAKKWNVPFFETSAKTKLNNEACFFEIVRLCRKQAEGDDGGDSGDSDPSTPRSSGKAGKKKKKSISSTGKSSVCAIL